MNPLLKAYQRMVEPPGSMLYGGRKRVFPSKHPMGEGALAHSNVIMTGYNIGGREYVLPTMEDGKLISKTPGGTDPGKDVDHREVVRRARERGLHNYPSFKTVAEADAYAQREHGNIDSDGFMKAKPKPSLVDAVLRRDRRLFPMR